ncbi:hypothetical protein [Asticcacaulis sp. YBE204]|uniref:hypothetical protein n=1 Tax=Asticcacaulis sp. YBE204 TaxID=1282363 RepID=UPI0003C3EC80|nr:hypothetical protein [Asticcacaulis sp. YBE204]ESQ76943.1 hypothetical protein AEYBE204_18885 [Asticcacaulis sp. YBE204]
MNTTKTMMAIAATALMTGGMATTASAQPRPYNQTQTRTYDGFCYQKETYRQTRNTEWGPGGSRTTTTTYTTNANCLNGQYYVFSGNRYDPPKAPRGYRIAYFYDRPAYKVYYTHKNGKSMKWDPRNDRHDDRRDDRRDDRNDNRNNDNRNDRPGGDRPDRH